MSDTRNKAPQAILVAGYYRSGTSALCGSLADLGVQISSDAQPNEANPKGFFESTELIKFDIRVLELMGSYWSDLSALPEGWIERADVQLQRDALAEILARQFDGAALAAVKHPHLCRLLPLYVQAATDIGYQVKVLHTHRSPYAVATSQATKNNMTRAHAVALWASYITSAEHFARDLPRAWVHYPELLRDADGAVRAALSRIGIEVAAEREVGFITKTLNRSSEADPEGLFPPLAALVSDIDDAIHAGAGPGVWDGLRARSADLAAFVDELGRSGNRSAPGVGQGTLMATPRGRSVDLAGATKAHPVRPSERGDAAEKTRVQALLGRAEREGGVLPSLSILIACPAGATKAQLKDTLDSVAQNWHQPAVKVAYATTPSFDLGTAGLTMEHRLDTDSAMTEALFAACATAKTDYVAILNAGDMIEPDAIARFTLRAAASGADMLYCDEIAPSQGGPWIRAKPDMALPRLLESCFVGDWVWYRADSVASLGGFRAAHYPGAEEQDMQIRLVAAGKIAENIPEALFVRGEDTRRDSVPLDRATESARASIQAHLDAMDTGTGSGASVRPGAMAGLFVIDRPVAADPAVTLAVLCKPMVTPDIAQNIVNRMLPRHDGNSSRIVFVRHEGMTAPMVKFLDQVETQVAPVHPAISVLGPEPVLGALMSRLGRIAPENHVAVIDPVSAPSADDLIGTLAALLDTLGDAGAVAPLVFFRDGERTARLHGPLLFGAPARIGAGYEAQAPGPGGWLATTQPVDAVDGPVVMLRRGVAVSARAASWAEVCQALVTPEGATLRPYWTPHRQVEIPDPGKGPDAEVEAARRTPYTGRNHHPAMTVAGSPLMLEGRQGLVDTEAGVLITTTDLADDARVIIRARHERRANGLRAGIVGEPCDVLSVLRARGQGRRWIRANPRSLVVRPGTETPVPADVNVWSTLPPVEARPIVLAAGQTIATSQGLATRLRGMGARDVTVQPPRLTRSVWAGFKPVYAKTRPAALWVEETGLAVPWIEQLIAETADEVAWTIATRSKHDLPGNVARRPLPVNEEDWARLFTETGASIAVRPTPGANWCDDHVIRLALAGGCRVIAGREADLDPALVPLVARQLASDAPARWVKALRALAAETPDPGARAAVLKTGAMWLETYPGEGAWLRLNASWDPADAA